MMRKVSRPKVPPSLSGERTLKERQAALDFYSAWDGASTYDGYKAYKAPDVRAALEEAFGGKCAYCETKYSATQPVAIEHYRPKGGVTIDGKRVPPGYYWLASEWTNLLPSCTDCNSPRGQDLPGETEVRTAGKANAFPLASEASRGTEPGKEKGEARLLLHPYLDFPEKHLDFVWGTATVDDGWVRPQRRSAKGAATIAVCALQRRGLRAARRDRLLDLIAHLESVVDAQSNVVRHPADPVLLEQLERRLAEVSRFVADHAPYSVMCRQVVASYRETLFGP
ncbi:MAG: hypothetical protein ACTHWA_12300 [Arachnia sp.]